MRAIGFSELKDRKEQQKLVTSIILNSSIRKYTSGENDTILAEFCEDFAPNIGIAVCGEFDSEDQFTYDYYYPYLKGTGITSFEDISVERHAEKESYAGICDDVKVGFSLIFYLQNMIQYIKNRNQNQKPIQGTSLTLSGLSLEGKILLPISKNENEIQRERKVSLKRNRLINAARKGDEEAIESLTLDDMDTYSSISKRIMDEDILSLVDSYFMPYGVECDQYSILGEIIDYRYVENQLTGESVCIMTINCNHLDFDICINEKDLLGKPEIGRRFKGNIWLQGYINYP